MKIAWVTDPHFNFVNEKEIHQFVESINTINPDCVVITGDITDARLLNGTLELIRNTLDIPVYFNLGNHDFYHGSFEDIRKMVSKKCKDSKILNYFGTSGIIQIDEKTCMFGEDCIGDGKNGDFQHSLKSEVFLNDYRYINELAGYTFAADWIGLEKELNRRGEESAKMVQWYLDEAIRKGFTDLYMFTHVPVFPSVCRHQKSQSDERWTPHYSCKSVGDVVEKFMKEHPECHIQIFSGHTHTSAIKQMTENICCTVGGAEYSDPKIQMIIEI
jgi:Icc protein